MEEKPEILTSPEVQAEPSKPEKSKTLPIIIGLVVVLVIFAGAVFFLSQGGSQDDSNKVTTAPTNQTINSNADLDKVTQDLDAENLDDYAAELDQNTQDASSF